MTVGKSGLTLSDNGISLAVSADWAYYKSLANASSYNGLVRCIRSGLSIQMYYKVFSLASQTLSPCVRVCWLARLQSLGDQLYVVLCCRS